MTILLIDDDQDDQDIFKEAASMVIPGIECMVANDGEQGFAILASSPQVPDYIFLDVNMPKMNGKEFLARIKSHPQLKSIPVVVYSTSSHKSELGDYFKLGASNFITKPSEFKLLTTYLKSILS